MKTKTIPMAAAFLAMAGCSQMATHNSASNAARSQASTEAQLCKDMTGSQSAIKDYPNVSQNTSLQEVQEANQKVERAVGEVGKTARKIDNPQVLEVQSAFQRLRNAVDTIQGGRNTVGPAADDVHADAGRLKNSWNSLYSSLQCGA
jgi:ABC-type Fe3+-hydroxamate transport system substrate-binding protein